MRDLMRRQSGSTLLELLVVIAILAILLGLTLPAVQKVRSSASRLNCASHLKQISLALHHYEDVNGSLPQGYTPNRRDEVMSRVFWQARILPFVGQDSVWQLIEAPAGQSQAIDHPAQSIVINIYGCPADSRVSQAWNVFGLGMTESRVAFTSYLGNSGKDYYSLDGLLFRASRIRMTDILDGTSSTILIGERPPSKDLLFGWWFRGVGQGRGSLDAVIGAQEINRISRYSWYRPCGPGPFPFGPGKIDDDCSAFHYWSLHDGGANFAFADGSVRFLPYSINSILPSLATRSGGEIVSIPE